MPSNRNSYTLRAKFWRNSCWNRRNRLEKILIGVVILLAILVFSLIIAVSVTSARGRSTCTTPECVKASSDILRFIDPTKDPCTNFYEFTCATFNKKAHETQISTPLMAMKDTVTSRMALIITEPSTDYMPRSLRQQRRFYQACMNTTAIELDKNVRFVRILEQLGGWPVMKRDDVSWDEQQFNWIDVMVRSRRLGLTYSRFLEVAPCTDCEGYDLVIKYPYLSKVDKLERDLKEDYINYMMDIAAMFGASNEHVHQELRTMVDFQKELYEIIENYTKKKTNETLVMIHELQETYPQIEWLHFINNLTAPAKTYRHNDSIAIETPEFLNDLFPLLARRGKRAQSNYIIWELIENNIDFLSQTLRDRKAKFELLKSQYKKEKQKHPQSRKDKCIRYSKDLFPDVAQAAFVRKYIDQEKMDDVKYMLSGIRNDLRKKLKRVDWMDTETREHAMKKLDSIKDIIGGPPSVYNADLYERETGMDQVRFPSTNVIDMRNGAALNVINRYYKELKKKSPKNTTPYLLEKPYVTINAYFSSLYNTMILSAGMLQGIFYEKHRPRYLNYGALGGVFGHEYTHGFSLTDGTTTKKEGTNDSWWSEVTKTKFVEKASCLIDEYDTFLNHSVPESEQNGTDTLEENIADFTGANLAYQAYQEWVSHHGAETKLAGLDYTPNQLFWISYSLYMCFEKLPDDQRKYFRDSDEHAVPSFRIIGPLRNSEYFARDFNCPSGSYMNPPKKCQIF